MVLTWLNPETPVTLKKKVDDFRHGFELEVRAVRPSISSRNLIHAPQNDAFDMQGIVLLLDRVL
jgi:hypothetical protein